MSRICLLVIALFFFGMASAHAQECTIEYSGSETGSTATAETSRTQAAAQQFATLMNDTFLVGFWGPCAEGDSFCNSEGCGYDCSSYDYWPIDLAYVIARFNGTYYTTEETCGSSECVYLGSNEGTWDVVCVDADEDGIPDDGDNSSIVGDNPCTGGNTDNCDDNCRLEANPDQADMDADGIGDACDDYYPECNIYAWNDDGSLEEGPVATSEVSKTMISTEELLSQMISGDYICSYPCCYKSMITYGTEVTWEVRTEACIGGTWRDYSKFIDLGYVWYQYNDSGVWDVLCYDADQDLVTDDGDNSSVAGDNPCTGGATENCDDNCRLIDNPDQADSDGDGVGDACDVLIYDVSTNQGPDGSYIPLEGQPVFSLASERIQWIAADADAASESGEEWEWELGIAKSYVSYWTEGMGGYSPETELILNDDTAGYYARWKWVNPVSFLPGDGWYWIKLISEDTDGNRSEASYSITVDTAAAGEPPVFFWPTTTNLGTGGEYIDMEDGLSYDGSGSQNILWVTQDPDAPDDGLGWGSRQGIVGSYVSYRPVGEDVWSAETEALWLSGIVGWYGRWSWVYPVDLIMADGTYEVKLISEDADGLRCEEVYTIEVDAP